MFLEMELNGTVATKPETYSRPIVDQMLLSSLLCGMHLSLGHAVGPLRPRIHSHPPTYLLLYWAPPEVVSAWSGFHDHRSTALTVAFGTVAGVWDLGGRGEPPGQERAVSAVREVKKGLGSRPNSLEVMLGQESMTMSLHSWS